LNLHILDGKYLIRTSDDTLTAADVALGYKQLLEVYTLRAKVEHKFAEAKEHHGLRWARGHSLPSMRIQARMTAMVQNIKRLVSFRRKSRPHMGRAIAQANASDSAFKVLVQPFLRLFFKSCSFRLAYSL